jgi:hypothetical protein
MVRSTRAEHFYQIGDDAFAAPSILPINRAQTLNRDAKHSADFVELLDLAGVGQVEVRSITRADLNLEAGRFGCKVFLAGMALRLNLRLLPFKLIHAHEVRPPITNAEVTFNSMDSYNSSR